MGYVREYRDDDARYIAEHLRAADAREIAASCGQLPALDALRFCASSSGLLCTIMGQQPAAVFGVVPVDDHAGAVWLVGTDELTKSPLRRQFLAEGRGYFDRLHDFRPLLFNYVDERNTLHIRWLEWVGCTFINRHPSYGFEKRPFLEFVRIKPCV